MRGVLDAVLQPESIVTPSLQETEDAVEHVAAAYEGVTPNAVAHYRNRKGGSNGDVGFDTCTPADAERATPRRRGATRQRDVERRRLLARRRRALVRRALWIALDRRAAA